jgi:hypothetical protein
MKNARRFRCWGIGAVLFGAGVLACSGGGRSGGNGGNGTGGTPSGTGGTVGSGGKAVGSGGAGSGGATASGGTTAAGGVPGTGGMTGTGGATTGAGGRTGAGGTSSTGGTDTIRSSGGAGAGGSGSGGAATGGATASGGTIGSGGNASGGTTTAASGGTAGSGGKGGAGTGGSGTGGSTTCAGHAISLAANGTGSASDAANARVEVDLKTDLPIGNAKRTVEFWAFIRSTDWVGEKNQIFYYGGTDATGSFGLDFGTNNVTGSTTNHATLNPFTGSAIRDDSGKDLGLDSSTDQWVHIAMTWDGTELTTYVNGLAKITAQGSGSTTTLNTAQSVLMIGCNPTNNNCFGGFFDEFRVWNVARTAAEIKDSCNKPVTGNETGLVGYWKFDETSGSTAADSVTSAGHTAHAGTLKADTTAHLPTFVVPATPLPLVCP